MAKKINPQVGVTDLSLDAIRKKRFRIDGDDNRILELNTSDLNLLVRLKEAYPKLIEIAQNAFGKLPEIQISEDYDFTTDDATAKTVDALREADQEMRKLVDYIFDTNVSEICAPSGSMYDPINGSFRYEHIVETLTSLYDTDVSNEMNKIASRVRKHTNKYVGK